MQERGDNPVVPGLVAPREDVIFTNKVQWLLHLFWHVILVGVGGLNAQNEYILEEPEIILTFGSQTKCS